MFRHGERCVRLETALAAPHSCSGRAPLPCLLEALGQMYLECKQCCHVLRGALRAVEETVDDNVLTLAGLSSDPLKEKHFTTKSGHRRKLCEDHKKAVTSELAHTHRWRRHNALEGNLVQGDVGIPVCWLPHLPRSAWCLQLHGRWHPRGRSLPRRRSPTLLHTLVRILQWRCQSRSVEVKTQGAKHLSKHHLHINFSFTYDSLFYIFQM